MSETDEAEYRRMTQARARNDLARCRALAGSASAKAGLYARTKALMKDDGWEPTEYLSEEESDSIN